MNVLAYVHMRNIYRSTGAGRVARQLTEHVAREPGVNVHILADEGDYRSVIDKVGSPWTSYPYHLFAKDTSIQQRQWLLTHRPQAEKFWPEAEIVHCTGESYVPTSRAKLVVTVHDAAYFDKGAHARNLATMRQSLKWRVLYATLSRTVDLFHTVSHFSADRLGTVFPKIRSRLRVIHNAVSPRFFAPPCEAGGDFLRRWDLAERPFVLFPGGLHYRKNADLLLKAWPVLSERMPDLWLVVTGHCDPRLAAQAAALSQKIRFTGFVDDDELSATYRGARAVWFPSRYEGFGLPVLEAMASGGAVVASNSSSIPEIAGSAAVLVDPNSVADNVDALAMVIDDSHVRARLVADGADRARQFTWGRSAQLLRKLYSDLL